MDIEKLIEQAKKDADFEDYPVVASWAAIVEKKHLREYATVLSTLQAENLEFRAEKARWFQINQAMNDQVDSLEAENKRLRADLERKKEYAALYQETAEKNLETAKRFEAALERVKRALAMMWFAYENKDGEFPHEYEIEARRAAEKILGPWAECMPRYLRNDQEGDLCVGCAHPFDDVCKGCNGGDRYEPKEPAEPVQATDESNEFTRGQWSWMLGRMNRRE